MHAADPPDEAPLISRREGEPPTAPTLDAPSWLRPGGRAPEPADAEKASATPPEVVPEAARPAPQAPGETLDASRAWAGETQLDTAGDAARRGPGEAADPARARGGAGGAIAPGSPLRRIEQFVLLECIGAGGMGAVFAAFDDKLERKVAIKLVATRGGDERARQRLLREAQALARLSHPNVVTVYEAGTLPDGELFIAMELVKGQTLRAWQRQPGRSWRDLVAMYAEAGRGLAAAHHSGIVHRDFKPDNVLVGDDGRVRVADFGLAFAAQDTAGGAARPAPDPDAPGSPPPAQALTAPGRVAGTPGYMAPEQLAGAAVDARADQFSFCAALHEALHGALPDATGAGPPAHGPRQRATEPVYPRWLRDALQRGLARDPSERFATMDALLAELLLLRERTRRRVLAAAVVATGFIATAALSAALRSDDPPPCPLATAVLGGVWDAPVRARSEAAILGTGQPFASSMWTSTRDALERYAQRWLRGQQVACEATYVRHVQSADLFERRMECLAARRRSLAAAVEMLQRQPAEAVTHASELLTSLGDIEPCADTGALLAPSTRAAESPARAAARPRVIAVRQQLASATALLAVEAVAAAEPIVTGAEQLAQGIDDDALRAELLHARGQIELAHGKIAESIAVLHQAVALAVSSHHDELPADVWLTLALAAGARAQRPDEIESWLNRGEAWLRRLGHPSDSRRILLERARGNLQYTRGDLRDAVTTLSHALDRAEALWGKEDPRLIPLLRDRAAAEARLRDARPAVADGERALALGLAAWGPSYPAIARSRLALGLLYLEQLGDVARSENEIALALHQFRTQFGADSIEVANCEQVLSKAGLVRGDYAAALQHAERAEQILALRLGPDSPRRGEALNGIGVLRFLRKDYPGSLAAYEAAHPILRAQYGTDHSTVAILLSNIGETLLALGRPDPARADFAQALDILRRKLGPDHADLALPLKGLGLSSLGAGRFSEARAPLEQALALRTRSTAASAPQELAEIRWALARTLRALGREPARTRELALAARDAYRGLGKEGADPMREIDRWLAGSGPPAP